jgi:hypothetical protein
VSLFVSDYINLAKRIRAIAEEATNSIQDANKKVEMRRKIDALLNSSGVSVKRSGQNRKYRDLLSGGFAIKHVVTIKRTEDPSLTYINIGSIIFFNHTL